MIDEPKLGLTGGVVIDIGLPRDKFPRNRQDIPGATQFFRRECYFGLGGLIAIPEGGWDCITCAVARMNGWKTQLFVDLIVDHHKPRNSAHGGSLQRRVQLGERDYALGYHPLFELVKCASRIADYPLVVGAMAWFFGYATASVRRKQRCLSKELIAFTQAQQLKRLFRRGK